VNVNSLLITLRSRF